MAGTSGTRHPPGRDTGMSPAAPDDSGRQGNNSVPDKIPPAGPPASSRINLKRMLAASHSRGAMLTAIGANSLYVEAPAPPVASSTPYLFGAPMPRGRG